MYFIMSSTLRQFNAPLFDARFKIQFFSDEQVSITLALIESVMICLSVLIFLFIRVCSVPAIFGSLFIDASIWLLTTHSC